MSYKGSPAGRRPPKGYAYEEIDEEIETLLGQSPGPALPAIPTSRSWNYGANFGSALPKHRLVQPTSDIKLAAKQIDAIMEISQRRETSHLYDQKQRMQYQTKPRPRGRPPGKTTPATQRTKREPTPDQTQLLHNLREATISPTRDDNQQSDATPSPPVPRLVSTDSSSPADPPTQRRLSMMSNNPLYPSPLYRPGTNDIPLGSTPTRHSSVDNVSEVSWDLERDIHEDDLQRTRPSKYRGEPHGRNITAPPRRPSGRAHIIQDTIEEEEEDEPTPRNSPQTWTAPARTIIPQNFRSEAQRSSPRLRPSLKGSVGEVPSSPRPTNRTTGKDRSRWIRAVGVLVFSLALAFALQLGLLGKVSSLWSRRDPFEHLPENITEAEIFHTLQSRVADMKAEMKSLSSELVAVRSEHAHEAGPTLSVDPITVYQPEHKMNFLSPANGAIVDPRQTTPPAGGKLSYWQRAINKFFKTIYRTGNPPSAALTTWQEPGDCWCTSTPDRESQISVLLNHDIVPEEVVVEHIPSGQTLDPGVAPRVIELWARYSVVWDQKTDFTSPSAEYKYPKPLSERTRPTNIPPAREESLKHLGISSHISLHDIIMDSLRAANSYDPPSAYSDDPLLGPNFYRISTMEYDIFQRSYRQQFNLDTIIDIPTIRVDKVAFRVKSNWGSNNTCIYRFKLHGHL